MFDEKFKETIRYCIEKINKYLKYKDPLKTYDIRYSIQINMMDINNLDFINSIQITLTNFFNYEPILNFECHDCSYDSFYEELKNEIDYKFSLPEKEIIVKGFKYKLIEEHKNV